MSTSEIFAKAFEGAPSGLLLLDSDSGRVLETNAAFLEICGRSRNEVMGAVFWQPPLVADAQAGSDAAGKLRAAGALQNAGLPLAAKDGRIVLLEVNGKPLGDGVLQLEVRDATAREAIRLSDRIEAQRMVAARATAEFAEMQRALQQVERTPRAAERAGIIVQELRAYSGQWAAKPEPVQLNELLESMHLTLQRRLGPDLEVVLDLGADVAPVLADPAHIRQVLLKLAANSREAMEHGGLFRVETRNTAAGDPSLGPGTAATSYATLAVTDNGPGLDDESWEHLFEPFFTTKANGNHGLGLAAVHGIVHQNRGRIWVQSEPGQGTSFRIYLPRAVQEPVAPAAGAKHAAGRTILLVEPNDGLRSVVASILKKRGYCVLPARESQEALRIARAERAVDLLISEPDAELATHMAALQPHVRTLFLNGHSDAGAAAGTATLAKPFELDVFLGKVLQVLQA
jgi:PAS domain S-box-containing protein